MKHQELHRDEWGDGVCSLTAAVYFIHSPGSSKRKILSDARLDEDPYVIEMWTENPDTSSRCVTAPLLLLLWLLLFYLLSL